MLRPHGSECKQENAHAGRHYQGGHCINKETCLKYACRMSDLYTDGGLGSGGAVDHSELPKVLDYRMPVN